MSGYAGLSVEDREATMRALAGNCLVTREVKLLDLSHRLISSVTPVALDGQVNFTDGDTVSRTLQMGFLDPDRALVLDGNAPSEGVAGLNRLIQVTMHVYVTELGRWVGCDVFTGRPSQVDRDGDTVTVEAQGKEILHLRATAEYTIPKGTYRAAAIRKILTNAGETRFRFPPNATGGKLPKALHVGGREEIRQPWQVARRLARLMPGDYQLDYDGSGYAWLRKLTAARAHTLVEQGPGANLTGRVKTTTDMKTLRNRVIVTGKRESGAAFSVDPIVAPASHPYSAQSLKIGSTPWYSTAFHDTSDLESKAELRAFGNARLKEHLAQSVNVQGTAVPVWHLDPGDTIGLESTTASFDFRWTEGSVPLGVGGDMTVGYQWPVRSATAGTIRRP